MSEQSPAATSNLDANFTVTTVPVSARRNVCYEFDTSATAADLALPYLVSVDGKVQAPGRARKLSKDNRKIILAVAPGSKVALFLNSDVHPDYRHNPVYAVEVNDRDILIKITEQTGRIGHARPVVGTPTSRQAGKPGAPPVDYYQALLTGDIWMSISHLYTEAEASALLPADTKPVVRNAVCSIYRGLRAPELQLQFPASDATPARELRVRFAESENAQANTTYCPLLAGVLSRTHPLAFAALLAEADHAGVSEMLITSCWRPMFGSIAHRAGLGLDVAYIASPSEKVHINRVGLREKGSSHNKNVTDNEKLLYNEYQTAKEKAQKNKTERSAIQAETDAQAEWKKQLAQTEPKLMRDLREKLSANPSIKQVFDPWYMEVNTARHDSRAANEQHSKNEKTHANHLHLTVSEPKIYE